MPNPFIDVNIESLVGSPAIWMYKMGSKPYYGSGSRKLRVNFNLASNGRERIKIILSVVDPNNYLFRSGNSSQPFTDTIYWFEDFLPGPKTRRVPFAIIGKRSGLVQLQLRAYPLGYPGNGSIDSIGVTAIAKEYPPQSNFHLSLPDESPF